MSSLYRSDRFRLFSLAAAGLLIVFALAAVVARPAHAHTVTPIGPYQVLIGWVDEPPVVGQRNAILVEISRDGAPIVGAEATLDAEIGYGGRTMRANLNPTDIDGRYVAPFIPSVRGIYSVRLFGTIEEFAVDQLLEPEEVGDGAMLAFPERLVDPRDLAEQVDLLSQELQSARTLALAGLGVGAVGLLVGLLGLLLGRRRS